MRTIKFSDMPQDERDAFVRHHGQPTLDSWAIGTKGDFIQWEDRTSGEKYLVSPEGYRAHTAATSGSITANRIASYSFHNAPNTTITTNKTNSMMSVEAELANVKRELSDLKTKVNYETVTQELKRTQLEKTVVEQDAMLEGVLERLDRLESQDTQKDIIIKRLKEINQETQDELNEREDELDQEKKKPKNNITIQGGVITDGPIIGSSPPFAQPNISSSPSIEWITRNVHDRLKNGYNGNVF
jgi:hypothetical protein